MDQYQGEKTLPGLETPAPGPAPVSPWEDRRNCAVKEASQCPCLRTSHPPPTPHSQYFPRVPGRLWSLQSPEIHFTNKKGPSQRCTRWDDKTGLHQGSPGALSLIDWKAYEGPSLAHPHGWELGASYVTDSHDS